MSRLQAKHAKSPKSLSPPQAGPGHPTRSRLQLHSIRHKRKFQEDPHWRDLILFYEYFHGDNGAGLGASHQTGWTGIVARMMHLFATTTPEMALELGKAAAVTEGRKTPPKGKVGA